MGLGLCGVRLNLELHARGLYQGFTSLMDLGAQDLLLTKPQLMNAFMAAGIPFDPNEFSRLDDLPAKRMGAEAFYRTIGFKRYACMDIGGGLSGIEPHLRPILAKGGMRWNALKQDLNHPLAHPDLLGSFDVVTDYGNNEHVFDVTQAYRTQHDLCRPGGLTLIQQQVFDGNGYYCFNPAYYQAMAIANGYEVEFAAYEFRQAFIPVESNIHKHLRRDVPLGLTYVMRKTTDAPFRVPTQAQVNELSSIGGRIRVPRLPDDQPRPFVPLVDLDDCATIGGRDALAALGAKARSMLSFRSN